MNSEFINIKIEDANGNGICGNGLLGNGLGGNGISGNGAGEPVLSQAEIEQLLKEIK